MEAVICPPALYLGRTCQLTKGTEIGVGAQTMHDETEGAFTGEISPAMLADWRWNMHPRSFRTSSNFNETDEAVNRKVHAAFEHGITPIVCVGETFEERESGETVELVANQVKKAFAGISET